MTMHVASPVSRSRLLRASAGMLSGSLFLAACGQESAPAVNATVAAPTAPVPRKLTHADPWALGADPTLGDYTAGIKRDFEAAHPGVTVEYVFGDSVPKTTEKVINMLAGGTPPDSMLHQMTFIRDWVQKGLMTVLDSYQAK